jgi:hypothetical protein
MVDFALFASGKAYYLVACFGGISHPISDDYKEKLILKSLALRR